MIDPAETVDGLAALLPWLTAGTLTTFLLVLVRTSAWVLTAPGLSARGVGGTGRLGLAAALSLFLTPLVQDGAPAPGLAGFAAAALAQVAIGLALGFLTGLLFAAFEVAGTLADLSSGFSFASIVDPLSGQPAAAFSRLFAMAFVAVLFASDAYQTIVRGFVHSFTVLPLTALPTLSSGTAAALGHAVTAILATALQVGAPLLGVLFLTDVALSMASRFVPQANALAMALPVKTLIALSAAGATLALLPGHAAALLEPAVRLPFEVLR